LLGVRSHDFRVELARSRLAEFFIRAGGSNQCARSETPVGARFFSRLSVKVDGLWKVTRSLFLNKSPLVQLERSLSARNTGGQTDAHHQSQYRSSRHVSLLDEDGR
jgi:hypothetical protein